MIKIHPSTQALIFDIDGTLADTMSVHYEACQIVCHKRGFDFPIDYFYAKAGIPTLSVFVMLMKDLHLPYDGLELGHEKEAVFLTLIDKVQPMPIVADLAKSYYGRLPMALGTGGGREVATRIMEAIGMNDLFDIMITADDVLFPKPNPETFLKAAEFLKIAPEHCLVFEDGQPGIDAAIAGGIPYIDVRPFTPKVNY
ncbi:MAG: beta-phosphoglucomutase family hydrolase [Chitinophagaceae bacterium]|nr:beta-phosphoglucomutase family hydrolase [Chitinophagaceae bacterium]